MTCTIRTNKWLRALFITSDFFLFFVDVFHAIVLLKTLYFQLRTITHLTSHLFSFVGCYVLIPLSTTSISRSYSYLEPIAHCTGETHFLVSCQMLLCLCFLSTIFYFLILNCIQLFLFWFPKPGPFLFWWMIDLVLVFVMLELDCSWSWCGAILSLLSRELCPTEGVYVDISFRPHLVHNWLDPTVTSQDKICILMGLEKPGKMIGGS